MNVDQPTGIEEFPPDPPLKRPHVFASVPKATPPRSQPEALYGRVVVAVVVAVVATITAFAAAVGEHFVHQLMPQNIVEWHVGAWTTLVSRDLPPTQLVILSCIAIALVAVCATAFESIAALMALSPKRRLLTRYRRPLGEAETVDRIRITVLVPAHNEEASLPITLGALSHQVRAPDRVIVVADNCTDRTVDIAREMGHDVFETVDNRHKKGGGLNQVLAELLPTTDERDAIMVMDADTSLAPEFLSTAADRLESDTELTAVGGVFFGEGGSGLLGQFQRNEFARYSLQIRSRRGRVFVLTGTATVFRASALLDVAAARGVFIPGTPGHVYDTAALTEDNELTLALKSLGATMVSPGECRVTTEIMPTWRNLWVQRQRWQRGALENLSAYGITRATIRYWGQQIGIGYGTIALNLALLLMFLTFMSVDQWIWFPFWMFVGAIFAAERVITAWSGGWRARILAAAVLPELMYDVFLQLVFLRCLYDITVGRSATWGHVQHSADASAS